MFMRIFTIASIACISSINAHGYMTNPLAEFSDPSVMKTKYITTMTSPFPGKYDDSPQNNVDTFTAAFKASGQYKTLRDMLDPQGQDCGNTNPNASPKAIPSDGQITWQNPDLNEGFIPSHMGPCELWLDDKRVFQDDNCAGHYTTQPTAQVPIDFSSCTSNCLLRWYWLALHEPNWQVYKNCVPLIGNGGSSTTTANEASVLGNAYAAGSNSTSDEYAATSTPSMITATPSVSTSAPTKKPCW